MAEVVITAGYLSVAGNDLSEHFTSIAISAEADQPESTDFGSGGWREYEGGLKAFTISADYNQDFAAAALDPVLWPLFGTKVALEARPDNAVVGADNPKWTGMGVINSYMPLSGSVGELVTGSLGVQGSGELTRAIV